MSRRVVVQVVVACGLGVACHRAPERTEAASAAPPVAVHFVAVDFEEWPATYEAVGAVRARTAAVISSKVMGYVREVHVQAGDRVRASQLLAALDARDLEANFRRADAAREEVRNAVPEAENAAAAAKASLELAQITLGRMKDLFDKKSISNQELDEATAKWKGAKAGYEMALARRAQLAAKITQAEQERQAAAITRGYAQIRAPFVGLVTARTVEPGMLATPGAPLLTLEREGPYRLEVSVEESRLPMIRNGQSVSVALEALNRTFQARVSEIVPAVDPSSRAYIVKIDLPPIAQLRSGMFGRAWFTLGARRALSVPLAAVIEKGQLQSVMVAEEGVARGRLITLGQRRNERVEVLSGLTAGESVIHPRPAGLADGARLEEQR